MPKTPHLPNLNLPEMPMPPGCPWEGDEQPFEPEAQRRDPLTAELFNDRDDA